MHTFDKGYWEQHWHEGPGHPDAPRAAGAPPNPYVVDTARDLTPGTALDAGCGEGAEALWLAAQGWQVTGADISATALAVAAARTPADDGDVTWVETDLTTWEPQTRWDLVVTSYAHPTIPQLAFYARVAGWVAVGGTLLVVGHLPGAAQPTPDDAVHPHDDHAHPDHAHPDHARPGHGPAHPGHGTAHPGHGTAHPDHGPAHPHEATATLEDVVAGLDPARWRVDLAAERSRAVGTPAGLGPTLHDVVVRATRLA